MKRRRRIRPVNPERRKKRYAEAFGPDGFLRWVHSLACSVPCCGEPNVEAAHATSRGAGGKWEDILPLCTKHHAEQHRGGVRTFQQKYGIDLALVAVDVHQRWRQRVAVGLSKDVSA